MTVQELYKEWMESTPKATISYEAFKAGFTAGIAQSARICDEWQGKSVAPRKIAAAVVAMLP